MNILDAICATPWAITPDALRGIIAIAQRHAGAGSASFHGASAPVALARGEPVKGTRYAQRIGAVALLDLSGPIFPKANLLTELSGATSLEIFTNDFLTVHDDPSIAQIVIAVDSPGGAAMGIADAADLIAASDKPVTAVVSGLCCSAAYWIASAADRIVVSQTALVGSIGVVTAYAKQVEPDQYGEMTYEIVSSNAPNKRPDPAADDGRSEILRTLDGLETLFISAVAANRGVGVETVRSGFGLGGIFVGREAVERSMADAIGTLDSVLAGLAARQPESDSFRSSAEDTQDMDTITDRPADRPDQAALAAQATAAATTAERSRVAALLALKTKMPAHGALIDTMIGDGTAIEQANARVIDAEAALAPMRDLGRTAPGSTDQLAADLANLPIAQRAEREMLTSPQLRDEFSFTANEPVDVLAGRRAAFLKASSEGRVRILSRPTVLACIAAGLIALLFQFFPDAAMAMAPAMMAFPLTTLAADTPRVYELGGLSYHPVIASDIIYEGAAVGLNTSGNAQPLVAGNKFAGFAKSKVDNSSGAAGDRKVELITAGEILLTISGAAAGDEGRAVYASDDDTFTYTAAGNTFVGHVKRYDSVLTKAVVQFDAGNPGRASAPLTASFSIAAQSGNGIAVAVQVSYLTGQAVAEARCLKFYLSNDSAGQVRVPPALGTDITIASGTDGVIIEDIADSSGFVTTEADGDADFNFTKVATGVETVYLNLVMPDGRIVTSGAIAFT